MLRARAGIARWSHASDRSNADRRFRYSLTRYVLRRSYEGYLLLFGATRRRITVRTRNIGALVVRVFIHVEICVVVRSCEFAH